MKSNKESFEQLVTRALEEGGRAHMRPVIEKELLHYDILFLLDKEGYLEQLTFQGGTALRLCYGAPRFSEDLDFVGGRSFKGAHLLEMKSVIERYIGDRYGLEVIVKEPKDLKDESGYEGINVDKWQISVVTSPLRKDLPRQRIKIEIANVEAYTRVPNSIMHNYTFLPDGYRDTIILVESLEEIMADKLVSLVNCQKYIRYRDIWDLRWILRQGASLNVEFVSKKINDYRVEDYLVKLRAMTGQLNDIVHSQPFLDEMGRFIPMDIQERTLLKQHFNTVMANEVSGLLGELHDQFGNAG